MLSCVVVAVSDTTMREQCLCQQRPMNCAKEPSMAKNSSPSRAPKSGAQLPDNRSAKNAAEPPKTPSHRHTTASKNNVQIFKCELRREVRVHRHDENI